MSQQTNTMNYLDENDHGLFQELKTQLEATDSAGDVGVSAAGGIADLCKKYHQIKGTLELALKAVAKIPFIGAKVVKAIRFLMSVADFACPVGGGGVNLASAETITDSSSSMMSLSLEQIAAFEHLDAAINSTGSYGFDASSSMAAMSFDKAEICSQYNKVRKFIKPVLPIIALIPGVGATVVAAINLLMGIADSICGGGNN
ncbi:MAG: hypothetical protein WKF90_04485 [Pyrinomonadaceae bacterium]